MSMISTHIGPRADLVLQAGAESLGMHRRYFDFRERLRARLERVPLAPYRERGLLFIHVPKCGGSSVERQIGIFHGHRSATYFRAVDPGSFSLLHKVALVRNPYARLASGFYYLKRNTTAPRDQAFARRMLAGIEDLPAFLEALEERGFRNRILHWLHFLPQWYFLCDASGRILVDHVGRLESFGDFAEHLASSVGVRIRNITANKSSRPREEDVFDLRGRRIVAEMYEKDFTIFGYDPDGVVR